MRQWQICTSLHAVRSSQSLLRNKQFTSATSLTAYSKVGTTVIETWKSTTSSLRSSCRLPVCHGAQNEVYLLLKELLEKVAEFSLLSLGRVLTVLTRERAVFMVVEAQSPFKVPH